MPEPQRTAAADATRILTEPRRPAWIRSVPSAPWLAVGTVCVGAFMGQLDASIVSTALPFLRSNFHASIAAVEWVVLVYVLVLAGTVAAVGKLADRIGRKLLYTYGFGIFVVGSAACALAPSLGLLVAARVRPGGRRGDAPGQLVRAHPRRPPVASAWAPGLGIQGAAQAVGLCVGPVLGGVLTALGGWRLIFIVNVPIGLVRSWARVVSPPAEHASRPRSRIDARGTVLLAAIPSAGLAALSLAAQPDTPGWTVPGACDRSPACSLVVAFARQRLAPGAVIEPRSSGPSVHRRDQRGAALVRRALQLPRSPCPSSSNEEHLGPADDRTRADRRCR